MTDKDKPLKDNAGRDLKPKEAARSDHAPVGSVGIKAPAPGQSTSGISHSKSSFVNATPERSANELSKTKEKEGASFKETGDREVDNHYSKEHKMTQKEKQPKGHDDGHER